VWLRRALGFVALVTAAYLSGIGATSLFPTTVETTNYTAQLRLTPAPTLTSTIHSPTSLGDINLTFRSLLPAPGVDATVGVRENITQIFDERRVSIEALQPSSSEVGRAISSALKALTLRFTVGALLAMVLVLGVLAYGRRRRPTGAHVVAAGLAVTTALLGAGVGAWQSYQPDKLESFTTTGLLGTLRRNAGLLSDVETRAQQATPYVRNLLALSQALQEKFVPGDINQPTAARILLVSDVHGANQYPVMKRIVADEQIDAVVDAGDLLNFGSVAEAEAAGLFTSIAGLGVPYLFVRGNHDAGSPDDQALLRRMGRIPNVVLLEGPAGDYTEASLNGVTIAGFNDPRWFGDDNKDNSAKQSPAAEAFNRAYAGRQRPDVVVSHEPGAVEKVAAAGLLVNGHLHTDQLEGNRIGVGTFTGGGTVSHFVQDAEKSATGDGGELAGQPYAFDIAVFGQSCTLTSLTRYTYRNLIQGRPAYDDVQVINGHTIQPPVTGSARTCAEGGGLSRTSVAPPPATLDAGPRP
jgi:predicted phosphodiesterase